MTSKIEVQHRYPWTTEEIAIIATIAAIPLGFAIWSLFNSAVWVWTIITLVVCGAAVASLIRLGRTRKNKSALTAVVEDGVISVDGFGLQSGKNRLSLEDIERVEERPFGISQAFVFYGSEDKDGTRQNVVVPARVARKHPLSNVILDVIEKAPKVTPKAKELAKTL